MAACRVRFSGQYDPEAVEEFINAITTFKTIEHIQDEDALKGISLLFTGTASNWWHGVRMDVNTWQNCLQLLRQHFAPTKPAYQLYREIFMEKQNEKSSINKFIIQKRALFAQLPEGSHNEAVQIDMIYGLINYKYRQHMNREDIKTFNDLLQKARDIEYLEAINSKPKSKTKRCNYCKYRGHIADECRRRQDKQKQQLMLEVEKAAMPTRL